MFRHYDSHNYVCIQLCTIARSYITCMSVNHQPCSIEYISTHLLCACPPRTCSRLSTMHAQKNFVARSPRITTGARIKYLVLSSCQSRSVQPLPYMSIDHPFYAPLPLCTLELRGCGLDTYGYKRASPARARIVHVYVRVRVRVLGRGAARRDAAAGSLEHAHNAYIPAKFADV